MKLEYEYLGYNRVENALRTLATQNRGVTDKTIGKWTKETRAYLKGYGYPAQSGRVQPFKTDRQRRWFFWALRNGLIAVPYRRTGRLANSWRAERRGPSDWLLGNSAEYSGLVIGEGRQSKYHEDNWWTAESLIKPRTSNLTRMVAQDLMKLTSGIGGTV